MTNMTDHSSSSFLSLPAEIRRTIYLDVLSNQHLVLSQNSTRTRYDSNGGFLSFGTGSQYYLEDSLVENDATIPLLSTSWRIHAELQPLLTQNAPSHLVISRYLNQGLEYALEDVDKCGVPFGAITQLSLHVNMLGENRKPSNECPMLREYYCGNAYLNEHDEDEPPPDPERSPNFQFLHRLQCVFRSFPALRELHIYDTLHHSLIHPAPPCRCAIAGTKDCACGQCACKCVFYPVLPKITDSEPVRVQKFLYDFFETRFREILPDQGACEVFRSPDLPFREKNSRKESEYYTILDLLAHGVDVYLHEEVNVAIPLPPSAATPSNNDFSTTTTTYYICQATYHLAHMHNAMLPAQPVTQLLETPGERRRRLEVKKPVAKSPTNSPERALQEIVSLLTDDETDDSANFSPQWSIADEESDQNQKYFSIHSEPREFPQHIQPNPLTSYETGLDVHLFKKQNSIYTGHWKWERMRLRKSQPSKDEPEKQHRPKLADMDSDAALAAPPYANFDFCADGADATTSVAQSGNSMLESNSQGPGV